LPAAIGFFLLGGDFTGAADGKLIVYFRKFQGKRMKPRGNALGAQRVRAHWWDYPLGVGLGRCRGQDTGCEARTFILPEMCLWGAGLSSSGGD